MPTPGTQIGSTTASHAASGNLTVNLPQAATAGSLLLVALGGHSGNSSLVPAIATPSGWSRVGGTATTSTVADKAILGNYYKVAAGGETSVTFTLTNCGVGSTGVAGEWAGPIATPLDQNGTAATSGSSSSGRTDSGGALAPVGPFDLSFGVHLKLSTAATGTPTSSWATGLTSLYVDPFTNQLSIDLAVGTSSGPGSITPSDTWTANGAVLGTVTKGFSFFLTPTATGSLTLAASGSASASPPASASLSLDSSGAVAAPASASASLSLASAASAAASSSATGTLTLGATGAEQGAATATASVSLTATAAQVAAASASATLTLAGAAAAAFPPATGSVSLSATASGSGAASSGAGSITLSAAGTGSAQPAATANITLAGTAAIVAAATSTANLTLTGTADAAARAAAAASITLGGFLLVSATGTATLTLSGSAIIPQADVTVTLPVLELTFSAPAVSSTGDTIIGLPLLELNITAPALYLGTSTPPDLLTAALYDRDGKTYLGQLPNARAIKWQDPLSAPGPASFEVPVEDASTALITDLRVVKFAWMRGGRVIARYGCRIQGEATELAVNGRAWVRFENQPGLLSFAGDGVVAGEYHFTLNDKFGATRNYGYMSGSRSIWEIPGQFVTPQGMEWDAGNRTTNVHYKRPSEFSADPEAMWISRINPNTSQTGRAANYFRTTFTVSEPTDIQILAAGDNYLDLFLDGQPVFTADYSRSDGWHTAQTSTTRINTGTHELSARCENGPLLALTRNPVAFICTVLEVDRNGKKLSVITRSDNTSAWVCCDDSPPPGWGRAQILRSMILDAQIRGAYGPSHLTLGFSYYHDSAGVAWTDHGNYVFDVATESLVDVIAQLCEAEMDVTFDPVAMRLNAWRRAGKDRSATVRLKAAASDASLKSCEMTVTNTRFNAVYTQLSTGEWIGTTDPASIAAVGRIEAGISLGSTITDPAALGVMRQQIDESSTPLVSITGQTSTLVGAQPYVDYFLGDSITVPNARNTGTMKARVMAITVDGTGPTVQAYPELVQDKT